MDVHYIDWFASESQCFRFKKNIPRILLPVSYIISVWRKTIYDHRDSLLDETLSLE